MIPCLEIPAAELNPDRGELARSLGYPGGSIPEAMKPLIEPVVEEIAALCRARGGYITGRLTVDPQQKKRIYLKGIPLHADRIITSQLKGAVKAAVFLCTIGPDPESRIQQWMDRGDSLQAFAADCTASLLAEEAAEWLHHRLQKKMTRQGLGVSNRFSPGYCGWDVSEQHNLFRLLPEGFCGVSLEASAFMQPRKSVSGIIGIGPGLKRKEYLCGNCDKENCLYGRKIR